MDVVVEEFRPPTAAFTAVRCLRSPEGGVSDPGARYVAYLPEFFVQLLPNILGPGLVVRDRGDNEKSATRCLLDGVDESLMPGKDLLLHFLQSRDSGIPDVFGPAADDKVAGEIRKLDRLAKHVDPVICEASAFLSKSCLWTETVSLRLVIVIFGDELVLGGEMVVLGQVAISQPELPNQLFFDRDLKDKQKQV